MPSVKEILKHYRSQPPDVLKNLCAILNHGALAGTGKLVILPVDQGFEHGPLRSFEKNPPSYDPLYHLDLAIESGCSALAAPLGFLEVCAGAGRGSDIPLILKLNSSDSLYQDKGAPIPALTANVESALRLGCRAVGFTIYPASSMRKNQYEELAQVIHSAKSAGLAVVVWSYPRGEGISKQGQTAVDVVGYSAHIACEMGAHIVKVKPPSLFIEQEESKKIFSEKNIPLQSLSDRVRHVIACAFQGKRIVIFSGGEAKGEKEFLEEIKELKKGGAFGSIIGRNAFQRPKSESLSLLRSVMDIYKELN